MLNEASRRERKQQARERLVELQGQGYRFLVTHDEGSSWLGSRSEGIEIEYLLGSDFVGNVIVDAAE